MKVNPEDLLRMEYCIKQTHSNLNIVNQATCVVQSTGSPVIERKEVDNVRLSA
jgi:hypothetical protein